MLVRSSLEAKLKRRIVGTVKVNAGQNYSTTCMHPRLFSFQRAMHSLKKQLIDNSEILQN